MKRLLGLGILAALIACGGDGPPKREGDAGGDAYVAPTQCDADGGVSCDNGVYCDGAETCDAANANAHAVTHCVPGTVVVCDDDIMCTTDTCDETTRACLFAAPDEDNDDHGDINCLDDNNAPLGDDCDDNDRTRFPGNPEVCTPGNANASRDEDCNPATYGDRDEDSDNHEDIRCCNPDSTGTLNCGDDCDDSEMTVYPGAVEVCDELDNDCDDDNAIDESPTNADWYPDTDGDQYGDPNGTPMSSCAPITGYSTVATDCDDALPNVNPGTAEACDGIDNNCNNVADEALMCGSGVCTVACGANASCAGNNVCVCDGGYVSSGGNCVDVNECVTDTDGCDSSPDACVNTVGGFNCTCPSGYMGNGSGSSGCADVDECATSNGGCGNSVYFLCTNNIGQGPTCTDINECATSNGGCGSSAAWTCGNNVGGVATCTDINECATNTDNCHANATCNNTTGSFSCACNSGYTGSGTACTDIDECASSNGGCGSATYWTCTNTPGSRTCTDIDECASSNGGCGSSSAWACGNSVGGVATCTDINECLTNNGGCGSATYWTCMNTSGNRTCTDIDECATGNGGCDALASCTNNAGVPVTCGACPTGYVGSGATTCTPTLTGLTLSSGTLTPGLNETVVDYAVGVVFAMQTITLTPTSPGGSTITINSQSVASGAAWVSPVLALGTNVITIVVSRNGQPSRTYTVAVHRGHVEAYLKASNTGTSDIFGNNVALSGNTLVVGAHGEASNATGINGNQSDGSAPSSGAVYVFVRSGTTWSQEAYIKASNAEESDGFGSSVAIDGNTLVVGARYEDSAATGVNGDQFSEGAEVSGAAYVFVRVGTVWSQQAYLKASDTAPSNEFGVSVAVSGDTIVVGAFQAAGVGSAYVFVRNASVWSQQGQFFGTGNSYFGYAVSISGDTIVVGAYYGARVYVFVRSGGTWTEQANLTGSNTNGDFFGISVAVSGDTFAVGAFGEDSNATGVGGSQANNNAGESGAVYIFVRVGTAWTQQAYVKASNTGAGDYFGVDVALEGDTLLVGAFQEDSNATDVNGNQADNTATESGAAYLFTRTGTTWSQQAYLKPSNTDPGDYFGHGVAVSGATLAVGAWQEDSNATGINGNQADNSASNSGAVYVFR